ncbi:hypothetical protein BI362_05420 [Streptococcus parauberis]|uniref:hypothetical protein n=1 Tax=Streptococcus TaxID=1301 RepID=UPI0008FA18F4|nr:hypothetical protein [Streptococcus infantarius subsp. infantarius]OHY30683.1 hypothetical protein BI362_05420 [Streptococcus parauberis]
MKKYKVIFNSSKDINSFQKTYFNNAINSDVYLLEKNASKNFLSFISENPVNLTNMFSDVDIIDISSENYDYNNDFPWCKNEKLLLNFYSKIFGIIAQFIQESKYWDLPTDEQDHLICQILTTVASVHKDGITHGYLSFYSNYLYYMSQLKSITNNETFLKIQNKITYIDNIDKAFVDGEVIVIKNLYDILKEEIKRLSDNKKELNFRVLPNPYTFFNNSSVKLEYSQFHKTVFSNKLLLHRYTKDSFYYYRIVMGIFFKILPLLGISMNRRNRIIFLSVEQIEKYFGISWETQINESIRWENEQYVNEEKR